MTERPVTCREFIDFIADYLDHELPAPKVEDFQRHLDVCPSCVAYLDTYQETIRASKAAAAYEDSLLEEAPEELIRSIRDVTRK